MSGRPAAGFTIMMMPSMRNARGKNGREDWPFERQGYDDTPRRAYAAAPRLDLNALPAGIRNEEFQASLIAGGAANWVAWMGTANGLKPATLITDARPGELLGSG